MEEYSLLSKREDAEINAEIVYKMEQITHFSHGNSYWEFNRLIEKLLELVEELSQTENYKLKANAILAIGVIKHTIKNEVRNVEILSEKMNKKNAAKKITDEYYKSIYKVSKQLKFDLNSLKL